MSRTPLKPSTDASSASSEASSAIDRRRFRRIRRFFFFAFLRIFWHDYVLRWPILRLFRSDPTPRWVAIAMRYRSLAVEMGGVLIKLGQVLSTRVDILPRAVTEALSGLQDEVPPAPWQRVREQIEDDFDRPLEELFAEVDPNPMGAASLAQVHRARLLDGQSVVVKVLRPDIDVLVETDLQVIGVAIQWVKAWRFVRERVDLDWLIDEFGRITRQELDLVCEAENVERFQTFFAEDDDVYLPRVYWETTARRTLTEENVAFIKIGDQDAMQKVGIEPAAVAKKLYQLLHAADLRAPRGPCRSPSGQSLHQTVQHRRPCRFPSGLRGLRHGGGDSASTAPVPQTIHHRSG